jgi:hypothetical protein
MTLQEMLQEARTLTADERRQLIKALVDQMVEPTPKTKRSLRAFRGVGARLYHGTDAQAYVNELRREWDERP